MPNLSISISILALVISTAGLTVSLMNYLRDRSRVRAWARFGWRHDSEGTQTPVLHLRIVNTGRRPITVLNLVKIGATQRWWRTIRKPQLEGKFTLERIDEYNYQTLAHNAGIKLSEGEVMELEFGPDDMHEFYFFNSDIDDLARRLEIEDIAGGHYRVKHSAKFLEKMLASKKIAANA